MNYRKGILLFNFLIPVVLVCVVFAVVFMVKGKIDKASSERSQAFAQNEQLETRVNQLQKETEAYSKHYAASWNKLLSSEVSAQLTQSLNGILQEVPSKDLQQTVFTVKDQKAKFASGINQKSSSIEMGFRGKYSVMQSVIAELEARFPHFLLESMKVNPSQSGEGKLDFNLNYVVWQK